MRDPERIDRMINLLREGWKKNPDLILGQIIASQVQSIQVETKAGPIYYNDPFQLEDGLMEQKLREYFR